MIKRIRVRKSRRPGSTLFVLVAVCLSVCAPTLGQWVEFRDETGARLLVDPISRFDELEKDIAVADFNRDGWDDVIVVRKVRFSNPGAETDILLMHEDGALVNRTADLAPGFLTTPTDARDVFIADVDGDGWDDVVIANTFEGQPSLYLNRGEDGGVWLGLANESFRLPHIVPGGPLNFCALWVADVTGDAAPDIYFSNYIGDGTGRTFDVLLINDGKGFFTDETEARLRGPLGDFSAVGFGTAAEIHDVDNDGDNDIIKISTLVEVAPWNDLGVFILFNDGNGVFTTNPFQSISPQNDPYMFTFGYLNDDDLLDVYFQNDSADRYRFATALVPDGPIQYSDAATVASEGLSGIGGNVKLADIDLDGDMDVGVASVDTDIQNCGVDSPERFTLLHNTTAALTDVFARRPQAWHQRTFDFAFLDVDRDGLPDLFQGNCDGYRIFVQVDPFERDCNSNGVPDGIDLLSGDLDQWAAQVTDFSSQLGEDDSSASQALGEPDTQAFGPSPTAWSPLAMNGTLETITLGYAAPVFAEGATIRETEGNGFVVQVDVADTDGALTTVWTGVDSSAPGKPVDFQVSWPRTSFLVHGLKVHVDTDAGPGRESIDAVRLHGFRESGSVDANENRIPDECECPAPVALATPANVVATNRFLAIEVGDAGRLQAIRVVAYQLPPSFQNLVGKSMWVGQTRDVSEISGVDDDTPPTFRVAALQCDPLFRDWSQLVDGEDGPSGGVLHLYGELIVPGGVYHVQLVEPECSLLVESNFSIPLVIDTNRWGDVTGAFDPASGRWKPPDASVDIVTDIVAMINKFGNRPDAPSKVQVDLEPATLDFKVNISDISRALEGFRGLPYPFAPPPDLCP